MWRLLPQGGDFFRREKYYPALDRPQATADAVRQSFQRQKEKSAFKTDYAVKSSSSAGTSITSSKAIITGNGKAPRNPSHSESDRLLTLE